MTYCAAVEVDIIDGVDLPLASAKDVDALVELLRRDNVGAATWLVLLVTAESCRAWAVTAGS